MNANEYFGARFFERAAPEQEFETYEAWCFRLIHEEREAIERIVAESMRDAKPAAPEIPAMPDGVPLNASIVEAWERFHRSPARIGMQRKSNPVPARRRPRPTRTRIGSEDPSAIPDWMRERP